MAPRDLASFFAAAAALFSPSSGLRGVGVTLEEVADMGVNGVFVGDRFLMVLGLSGQLKRPRGLY